MTFAKYPKMKDSGINYFGMVPEGWDILRLSWIAEKINDIDHKMPESRSEGIPFLSAKDLVDGDRLNFDKNIKFIDEEDFQRLSRSIKPQRNDIIYSRIGIIGKARLVKTDKKFLVSYSCCVIRVKNEIILPQYCCKILGTSLLLTEAKQRTQGIGVPDLGLDQIGRFPIPLPPIKEQKQISSYLDKKTAKIDDEITKNQNLIKLLKEKRESEINRAVTKGLDDTVPMKDSGISIIGQIPESWSILKGKYFLKIHGSGKFILPLDKSDQKNFFKVEDLNNSNEKMILDSSESFTSKSDKIIQGPLILIPKRGEAIHTNKVVISHNDCSFDSNVMGISTKIFDLRYVAYFILSRKLSDIADTTTIPQINNKHIYPLEFSKPPINEQKQIVSYLDKKITKIDSLISKIQLQISKLEEFRESLISSAVTGKICVTN